MSFKWSEAFASDSVLRLVGTSAPAAATYIAARAWPRQKPLIAIFPDEDTAAAAVEFFRHYAPEHRCELLPGWVKTPYAGHLPPLRARAQRMRAIHALRNLPATVIVTTPGGLLRATLPPATHSAMQLKLEAGTTLESREGLANALRRAGYSSSDLVEDPGTFSIRGELVDIFPVDRDLPLRIELFDLQIERVRAFGAKSQRTQGEPISGPITIPPATEVVIHADNQAALRKNLKQLADDAGVHRSLRDPVLASAEPGYTPSLFETWAPLLTDPAARHSLVEEWRGRAWLAVFDEDAAAANFKEALQTSRETHHQSLTEGALLPAPELLLGDEAELERMSAAGHLFFDAVEMLRENARTLRLHVSALDETQGARKALDQHPDVPVTIVARTELSGEKAREAAQSLGIRSFTITPGRIPQGFVWPDEQLAILPDSVLLGSRKDRPTSSKHWSGTGLSGVDDLNEIRPLDLVVHRDMGISKYLGLVRLDLAGGAGDFLALEFAGGDKLYVPAYRMNVVQRYFAAEGEAAILDRLGHPGFERRKEEVRNATRKLAINLIQIYAQRASRPGHRFSPPDSMIAEFEEKFPFSETPDQAAAIDAVYGDLASGKSMDRLVCGDVGFGKTEVAMRAAYRAVSEGKQVIVLVPTTVLCFQHENSFRARFKPYGVRIESLSRFKAPKEQAKVLEELVAGKIDIVIGTHRLLSNDVKFKDLGLVIVDEEHRFGVEHKEKLKAMCAEIHVLTLTATPIPRTLHMALSGLREISLIRTPPEDRLPIRTFLAKKEDGVIRKALEFELERGGQVFFLHNRVQTLDQTAETIQRLVPRAKIGVAHGQLDERSLEKVMFDFYERRTNVLVCTTIIESGLDIPSANTIIIDRADRLGLAQLYQIRGRVGRGQARGYAYLLVPPESVLANDARRRLEAIQRFVELGSGFQIASHDLEIRGGGDILGPNQSGHIAAVGFELYTEMLESAIQELRAEQAHVSPEEAARARNEKLIKDPEIKVPFPAFLPETYVPDVHQRLVMYRRLSTADSGAALIELEAELQDRFGRLPIEASHLLWMLQLKILLRALGIASLTAGPNKLSIVPGPYHRLDHQKAVALMAAFPRTFQILPESKIILSLEFSDPKTLFQGVSTWLEKLAAPVH